jgi:hypothetical protein
LVRTTRIKKLLGEFNAKVEANTEKKIMSAQEWREQVSAIASDPKNKLEIRSKYFDMLGKAGGMYSETHHINGELEVTGDITFNFPIKQKK